jgi:hypothetical protein
MCTQNRWLGNAAGRFKAKYTGGVRKSRQPVAGE